MQPARIKRVEGPDCPECGHDIGFDIAMAFQPIVNVRDGTVYAHEALVRGTNGESAGSILSRVTHATRYSFDQLCRVTAVETAARLGMQTSLSINFMPNAIYDAHNCLRSTLDAVRRARFPTEHIIFEFSENEPIADERILAILSEYKRQGFRTAIDDFGAGYAGLSLLVNFCPDIVKIDLKLVRDIDSDPVRRTILSHTLAMCRELGCEVICEGIETADEARALADMGVDLMQGYLFAKPALRALPRPARLSF